MTDVTPERIEASRRAVAMVDVIRGSLPHRQPQDDLAWIALDVLADSREAVPPEVTAEEFSLISDAIHRIYLDG